MKIVTQIGLVGDAGFAPAFMLIQACWIVSNTSHIWAIVVVSERRAPDLRPIEINALDAIVL